MKTSAKTKISLFCLLVLSMTAIDFLLFNVHISKLYVQQQARLYPANFTIERKCSWSQNGSFDFGDYKPHSFIVIARMLSVTYKKYGIIPIIRDGSFLHTFRRIKADKDMDIFLIVPKNITMWEAYTNIRYVIQNNTEFKDIQLETQNVLVAGIFFHKSDAIRISFNGTKIVDVNVLHETFLNDPDLQAPCLKQMHCERLSDSDDSYIEANSQHITTKLLFESLCECDYMDSTLFCFNLNGAKYLEIRYGKNFTQRSNSPATYQLIYERPHKAWRKVLSSIPSLMKLKSSFEGHQNERIRLRNQTSISTIVTH